MFWDSIFSLSDAVTDFAKLGWRKKKEVFVVDGNRKILRFSEVL